MNSHGHICLSNSVMKKINLLYYYNAVDLGQNMLWIQIGLVLYKLFLLKFAISNRSYFSCVQNIDGQIGLSYYGNRFF